MVLRSSDADPDAVTELSEALSRALTLPAKQRTALVRLVARLEAANPKLTVDVIEALERRRDEHAGTLAGILRAFAAVLDAG